MKIQKKRIGWFGDFEFCAGKIKSERGKYITHNSPPDVLITHVQKQMAEKVVETFVESKVGYISYFGKILAM